MQYDCEWSTGDTVSTIIVSPLETTIYSIEVFVDLDLDGVSESLCFDEVIITTLNCGCTDPLACNYCSICTIDDDSCWYADDCDEVSIDENSDIKRLIKITDVLGRERFAHSKQLVLLYIYDDGSVEKKCIFK